MFWRRKKEETSERFNKVSEDLKYLDRAIAKIQNQIDFLEAKLRSKFLKFEKKKEDLEEKTEIDKSIKDDGFDDLRELRKSGVQ